MLKQTLLLVLCLFVALSSISFAVATCSENAYREACNQCPFDRNGKMDTACYEAKKQAGIGCITSAYPVAAAKYASGKCPQISTCISKLKKCDEAASTGNDMLDCVGGARVSCYIQADRCIMNAATECEAPEREVCGFFAILLFIGGGLCLAAFKGKSAV